MENSEPILEACPLSYAINSQSIIYPENLNQLRNVMICSNDDQKNQIYVMASVQPETYPTPTQGEKEASNNFVFDKINPILTLKSRLSRPSDDGLSTKQSAEAASMVKPMTDCNPTFLPPKKRLRPDTTSLKDDQEHQQKNKRIWREDLKETQGDYSCAADDDVLASLVEHLKCNMHYTDITDPKIILEKELTYSDMNDNQGRLSIPAKKTTPFLTHEEEEDLKEESVQVGHPNKGKAKAMQVKVIMGSSEYSMPLSRWQYNDKQNNNKGGWKYVLKNKAGEWNKLKKDNGLQVGDFIRLVSFRSNNNLCFAILQRKRP